MFIALVVFLSLLVVWPKGPNIKIGNFQKEFKLHLGLDLQGGSRLVYRAKTEGLSGKEESEALESLRDAIDRRINILGVAEPVIQMAKIGGQPALIVEMPGIQDIEAAKRLIGTEANLQFQEPVKAGETGDGFDPSFKNTGLSGKHVKRATIDFQSGGQNRSIASQPVVSLELKDEGPKLFEEITGRNLNQPVAIVLDGQPISIPVVQSVIAGGRAEISGSFTITEARELKDLINAGALPVPIEIIEERTVGASLGRNSILTSFIAGLIGFFLVFLFMTLYYRLDGFIAGIALLIYFIVNIAFYKLIPVTLTLAGIAGFILSIGAAVDANILIFERTKEELEQGKSRPRAFEEGFYRAKSAIMASNISSLITAAILFWFGTGSVRGFALTLSIGILVSLFTALTVTRNLLKLTFG